MQQAKVTSHETKFSTKDVATNESHPHFIILTNVAAGKKKQFSHETDVVIGSKSFLPNFLNYGNCYIFESQC